MKTKWLVILNPPAHSFTEDAFIFDSKESAIEFDRIRTRRGETQAIVEINYTKGQGMESE